MTFATKIQTYDGTHASHYVGDLNCAVDWANNRLWMGGASNYLCRYGIVTGTEDKAQDASTILSGIGVPAVGWDTDGNVYATGPNALGHGSITKINGTTFALISNTAYAAPNLGGANIVAHKISGSQYVLDANIGNSVINLNNTSLVVDGYYIGSFGWLGGSFSKMCMGKDGTSLAFIITSPTTPPQTLQVNVQRLNLALGTTTTIATFVPTDIDASWTYIRCSGVCLDQTDGHVLAHMWGNAAPYNYLIKINSSTGAIVWKSALTTTTNEALGDQQMSQSRIRQQRLAVIQQTPVNTISVFNTSDGSLVSTQTAGLVGVGVSGQQAYDDSKGVIIGMFSYTPASGGPTPLNASTGPFTGWAALYVAAADATPGVPGGPATSRKRAWTFTLDGHEFYVLDLGAEGTWAYDKSTQTWMNFYTLNYVQWDVCNGVMWGNRIVGGDLATTDVWECAASTQTDNGLYSIPHKVTGGIQTRSRAAVGCAAVLLSASLGDLYDVTGSSMQMRYSDDGGNTFTAYDAIAMAQSDYSTELRWRSLGAFAYPGRTFQFYDEGGPRAIYGCDAFLDDFDAEKQPALTEPQ